MHLWKRHLRHPSGFVVTISPKTSTISFAMRRNDSLMNISNSVALISLQLYKVAGSISD